MIVSFRVFESRQLNLVFMFYKQFQTPVIFSQFFFAFTKERSTFIQYFPHGFSLR